MNKPLWKHDCSKCVFLQSYEKADLYYCQSEHDGVIVIRYSNEPSDNSSYLINTIVNYPVGMHADIALVKAVAKGLIKEVMK
jgi:hypothetical protein